MARYEVCETDESEWDVLMLGITKATSKAAKWMEI